jgi:nucleotide-binding universal stress UspA family protein
MTNVVVTGVDGSETATLAAKKAARIAQALGNELVIVCAFGKFEAEEVQLGGEVYRFSNEESAAKVAGDVRRDVRNDFPGLRITSRAQEGGPADALLDVAEELDAELIVVGNKRVQGPVRVLGSIARSVAQKASCDVYVAHTISRG